MTRVSARPAVRCLVRCAAVLAAAASGGACATVQLSPTSNARPGTAPNGALLGGRVVPGPGYGADSTIFARGRDRRVGAQGGAEGARRVCRSGPYPRGWVAVAYERGGDGCPGRATTDSAMTTAVVVRYVGLAFGSRLDVCADQPVPPGWVRVDDEAPGALDACPGAERGGRPGVRRISRVN